MGGEQDQPREHPFAEGVDDLGIAIVGLNLPMGRDRPQVDDPDVADRRSVVRRGRIGGSVR